MWQQQLVFAVLLGALLLFVWGRFRYDMIAVSAITILAVTRVLDPTDIFHGFANDAVLSVVAVMVVGRAIRKAGATEPFAALLLKIGGDHTGQTMALTGSVAFFSSFMNNTGALAVFLPVAVHMSRAMHRLASSLLMPLAFASLLGGLITLIGTPPNILVSAFRQEHLGEAYQVFDFTPVGLTVALVGILYLSLLGWRLLPPRRGSVSRTQLLRLSRYFAEARVRAQSPLIGKTLRDLHALHVDATVVGLIRGEQRILAPLAYEPLEEGDILLVEAAGPDLDRFLREGGLELGSDRAIQPEDIGSEDVQLQEIVIAQRSPLVGRTAKGLRMRWRYGLNVLAISRRGSRIIRRLPQVRLRAGDVLLVQIRREGVQEVLDQLHCYTLLDHAHPIPSLPRLSFTVAVFGTAIALVVTNVLALGVAFLAAAWILVVTRVVSIREATSAVDWSVVVLLGSTICLGTALESTGGASRLALGLLGLSKGVSPELMVALVMIVTMVVSNVINNAATAVLMAPIALALATDLSVNPDTFLMAVAIGASSCFLTPIGHQCNTLVLGPGGYHFRDYARLGLPLSILVIAVALPMLFMVWPLR